MNPYAALALLSIAPLLAAGCAGAPPSPGRAAERPEPPLSPPAPLLPARWIEASGATMVGPALAEGTIVLLGGRRALVSAAGEVRFEKAKAPEPLLELILVPTSGGQRLVGRGTEAVYRFEDPLGPGRPLARVDGAIARLGAAPGVVAVWTMRADLPMFLDVETGKPRPLAGLPEPPLRAVAFLDERRGAAVFEAAGLAVTTDGGASWRLAESAGPGDALRMAGVRRRGDALRAFSYIEGPDAAIDLAAAKLAALEPQRAPEGEAPILRWVRLTGRDPLEVAASSGVEATEGSALVASHGLLARVDLKTGAPLELAEFARGKWMNPCSAARVGQAAWVACTLSEDQGGRERIDPFGVFRVPLGQAKLAAERPSLVRSGEAELVVSPSGGALLLAPCDAEDTAEACVRKPDGAWASVHLDTDLDGRGAGPLADGRVAFLRGVFEGDQGPGAAAAKEPAQASDDEATRPRRIHVALVDLAGKEQALGPIDVATTGDELRVLGAIEEQADQSLRFVIDGGRGPEVVIQPPGREAATVQRVPGATVARIRGGRGVAAGPGRVLTSLDAGATWSEVAAPPRVLLAAQEIGESLDGWTRLELSDVGVKLGPALRLGWGPSEAMTEPPPPLEAPRIEAPRPPLAGPEQQLTCTSEGKAASAPPLLGSAQIKALLGSKPPDKGTRRETSSFAGARASMLDAVALLEEQGPDKRDAPPATWTLAWFDPTEVGGKPRSVTVQVFTGAKAGKPSAGAAEGEATWGASLRHAAASGARALFYLRAAGKNLLARVKPGGEAEIIEVKTDLLPAGEVVFGADKGEAIAWMHESTLVVWLAGEAPRAVASIATHAARSLGQPTRDGVPVMLGANDWALARVVPIPPLDRKAAEAPPAGPSASLEGWTRVVSLRRDLGALGPCAGKPKGLRFVVPRSSLAAQVDGVGEVGSLALYDVRVAGSEACVAAVSGFVSPDRRTGVAAPSPAALKKKGAAEGASYPISFLRADLLSKRAEGGDRGLPPASTRRLRCTLTPRP